MIRASVLVILLGCQLPQTQPVDLGGNISFDIISTEKLGDNLFVKVKVINTSGRFIRSAEATCILCDAQGRELDVATYHVIKGFDGEHHGLAAGDHTYFEFPFGANYPPNQQLKFRFKINSIRWQ